MDRYAEAVRLEVLINGERRCVAGVSQCGVLSAMVDSVMRQPECKPKNYTLEDWCAQRLRLSVGGLETSGPKESDSIHVGWAFEDLKVGDEIMIRILGAGQFDQPLPRDIDE